MGDEQLPAEWTNADDLRLQKLNQGLSQVETDLGDGVLDDEHGQQVLARIHEQRQPLLLRRQASQAQQQQQQQQQVLHANAMRQSLTQADAAHDAQNFDNRTASKVHPVTGQQADFFQRRPGEWEQIDWPESAAPESAAPDGEQHGYEPPREPTVTTNPDGTLTTEIWNGTRRTLAHFAPDESKPGGWRSTGTEQFDAQGQPQQPPTGDVVQDAANAGVLNPHLMEVFRKQALQQVGPPPPMMLPGRFGPVQNRAYATWLGHVSSAQTHFAEQYAKTELAKLRGQQRTAEAQRHEGVQQAEAQRKDQTKQQTAAEKQQSDLLRHYEQEVHKEWEGQGKSHAQVLAEAERRMKLHKGRLERPAAGPAEPPEVTGFNQPSGQNAPAVRSAAEKSPEEILAKLREREAKRQAAQPKPAVPTGMEPATIGFLGNFGG